MWKQIKNHRKKVFLVSLRRFNEDLGRLNTKINSIEQANKEIIEQLEKISQQLEQLQKANQNVANISYTAKRFAAEAVWAEIFNNTISGCNWGANVAYSPGRWAVGYQYLYVMYRVLDEIKPKRILELGLGQSTRMLGQYALANQDVQHYVVEHDATWIDFFSKNYQLGSNTKIVKLDREFIPFKEADKVRVFKGFREQFAEQKFDFISIDAPLGGDMKDYARIDVLLMLPEILSDDFVIMIDDTERSGEQHTIAEMEKCLKANGIKYKKGYYSGNKDCCLICAEHLGFLTSM